MKLGILGGTFDPIHLGHLVMGETAIDQLQLDELWFVPAAQPPHKPGAPMSDYDARCVMARLALAGRDNVEVSEIERPQGRPSYTVDTLRRIRDEHGVSDLWLILGEDSIDDLPSWKEPQALLELARVAALPRPSSGQEREPLGPTDHPNDSLRGEARQALAARLRREVVWLDGPRLEISASDIRRRVRQGRSIRYLVCEPVRAFIAQHALYADRPGSADQQGD